MQEFNENKDIKVFLISLKAGGTGLNLTSADIVVHFDPWWNPAVEEQATDRAHRIGQKNIVQVIKLISEGTIEDKIINMQEEKRSLLMMLSTVAILLKMYLNLYQVMNLSHCLSNSSAILDIRRILFFIRLSWYFFMF